MIFKKWFAPKWQHKDVAIRLDAITDLSAAESAHKNILHELAFNDGAETVRSAALEKLNEFSLWWQASKHESAEKLKHYAEQKVISMLLENKVEPTLKRQFIEQCNRSHLLEQLAVAETDADTKFLLLKRLNKPELVAKSLTENILTLSQKQQLLQNLDDEKILDKLSRQLTGELAAQLAQQLSEHEQKKTIPLKLHKQLTLILAKLNAVRDRFSLTEIPGQLTLLRQEWQKLEQQFDYLAATEKTDFLYKYHKINQQIDHWLAPKLADVEKQQQENVILAQQKQQSQLIEQQLNELTEKLTAALTQSDLTAAQQIDLPLQQLQTTLTDSRLPESLQNPLQKKIDALQKRLQDLPRLTELLAEATRLLAEWSAQALPEDAESYQLLAEKHQSWLSNWRRIVSQAKDLLPDSFSVSYQQLRDAWQQCQQGIQAETEKQLKQCRQQLADFKRLYHAGKFKVLFGLYKNIERNYQSLSASQQIILNKEYLFAQKTLSELADWQEYIATPRKEALLADIQKLATEAVTDAHQRADEVKQARAVWNSLGKAEAERDTELNKAFNIACEQAFEPCRAFFARLEEEKAENIRLRQHIISQLLELAEHAEDKSLEARLTKLTQAWKNCGAVERSHYQSLQKQYQDALKPLRQKIKDTHHTAAVAKQSLINKATDALQLDDINEIANILKTCQQQWKTAGFAGKIADSALWQQFREICDAFFNIRYAEFRQQQHASQNELKQQIVVFQRELDLVSNQSDLAQLEQQILAFSADNTQAGELSQLKEKLQLKKQALQQIRQQNELDTLFDLLDSEDRIQSEQLPAAYRDCFNQQNEQVMNRQQLTLALEIISGVPGAEQENATRQQVQLLLLSDKHNEGKTLEKTSLLHRWLQYGPLKKEERPLLQRVRRIFLTD